MAVGDKNPELVFEFDADTGSSSESMSPLERLGSLTYEQVLIVDLLSQGHKKSEIAQMRETQTPEIGAVLSNLRNTLGVGKDYQTVCLVLGAGLIEFSDDERIAAREELAGLNKRDREIILTIMPGLSHEEASKKLNLTENTLGVYLTAMYKVLDSHSLPETLRIAFAGELATYETQDPPVIIAEHAPISRQNTEAFLRWMYPREPLTDVNAITSQEIEAIAEILIFGIKEYISTLDNKAARNAKDLQRIVLNWLEGYSIPKIAQERGKTDGAIALGLSGIATKLADRSDLHEILERARTQAHQRTMQAVESAAVVDGQFALETGETTAKEVIISIRNKFLGEKLLTLYSNGSETAETEEDDIEPAKLLPSFQLELITLLNVRREWVHVDEIAKIFLSDGATSSEIYDAMFGALADMVAAELIHDEGDGFYSSPKYEIIEEEAAELEVIEETIVEPEIKVRANQDSPRRRYPDTPDDFLPSYPPVGGKRTSLQDMIIGAGISNDVDKRSRKGGRSKKKK